MKRIFILTILIAASVDIQAQQQEVAFSTFQLSDTVYMLVGQGGNVGVSAGDDGLFIIDDQLTPITTQLLEAIRKISNQPIRFVINTHVHFDHTGGNEAIGGAGTVIIAHDNIRKRMTSEQINLFLPRTTPPHPQAALPVVTFNDQMSLHLNGETATAYHVANGHTDGDSIIHFPLSNVIHMGDMYFNGMYPYVDLEAGGSIHGVIQAAALALSLADDETRIIPGHGPLAITEDLRNYRDMLVNAVENVQMLIDDGKNLQQTIEAQPTAEWDEELGKVWITPAQFVTFIYNSLEGIHDWTPPVVTNAENDAE